MNKYQVASVNEAVVLGVGDLEARTGRNGMQVDEPTTQKTILVEHKWKFLCCILLSLLVVGAGAAAYFGKNVRNIFSVLNLS